jgi:hypothetical protein
MAAPDDGQKAAKTPKVERCLSLIRIEDMRILDNQRIVFEMTGEDQYLNVLPRPCPGMDRNSTIMYRTSLNELCDLDVITLLDSIGSGYMPGASCGLGMFIPISKQELADLQSTN